MAQFDYNYTNFGLATTSTGQVVIKSGPTFLHSINVTSSGTGAFVFYNSTTSSTGTEVCRLGTIALGTTHISYVFDAVCHNGLTRGHTTSTADVTVTWA